MRALTVVVVALLAAAAWADAGQPKQELEGDDDARAADAAQALGDGNDAQAVPLLIAALEHGAAPKVQAAMLDALAKKKDARALDLLIRYANNRNAELRKKALAAIVPLGDARAAAALVAGLSDSDAEVRAQAAAGIAQRRQKGAEEQLIKLMLHKDMSAAGALAAVATPALAHRLSELIGQAPDPILCTALGEMLKRADFGPEPIRIEVVRTLAKVPGVDSTAVLVEYIAATERDKNRPSRLEAQKVVDDRSRQ
jgi:HEAT repeat protein